MCEARLKGGKQERAAAAAVLVVVEVVSEQALVVGLTNRASSITATFGRVCFSPLFPFDWAKPRNSGNRFGATGNNTS